MIVHKAHGKQKRRFEILGITGKRSEMTINLDTMRKGKKKGGVKEGKFLRPHPYTAQKARGQAQRLPERRGGPGNDLILILLNERKSVMGGGKRARRISRNSR